MTQETQFTIGSVVWTVLIAAGMIACILKATLDAWVLLVEINR